MPGSPWQRGTNELLRQYFPERTDLSVHTAVNPRTVEERLNTRPPQDARLTHSSRRL